MIKKLKQTTKTRLSRLVYTVVSHGYTIPYEVEHGQHFGLEAILAAGSPDEELTLERLRSRFVKRLRKVDTKPASVPTQIRQHYLGSN